VRRAVEFIEAHADTIGTVREIADAAGVSIRTLQVAFRAERAESPAACLRDVRLARAHAALLAADPGSGDSVTEIALRHGFAHAGRFAAAYRRRYGQAPGATLRA
jgi:transcriptional regulator GlxA family with amidase domain